MLNVILFVFTYISGFILSFRSLPVFAFCLYQAVYFFFPQNKWWNYMVPDLSYSFFTVVLMAAAVAINFKHLKNNKLFSAPPMYFFTSMLLLMVIVDFYAINKFWHGISLVDYIKLYIIMMLAFKLVDSSKAHDYILWAYIYGAWYLSFIVFQMGRNASGRVEGLGPVDAPDANGLSAALAPSIVLAFFYFWRSKTPIAKGLFAIACVFIANAIVLANSRGAFLGVACSMAFFMWHMYFSSFQKKNQKLTAVWLTIIGISGALYVVDDSFIERVKSITQQEVKEDQETAATRTVFWKAAVEVAFDHPAGLGVRGFDAVSNVYIPANIDTGGSRNRSVHSTWLETLTELGFAGLFSLIGMLLSCVWCLKKVRIKARSDEDFDTYFKMIAIQASCIAFLICMTFINRMRSEILYWLVLFCATAYNVYVVKPKREKNK